MQEKTILIAGSSKGLGQALEARFEVSGHPVVPV